MKPVARRRIAPSTLAFSMCMVVAFIEMLGPQSCTPVLTPYGTTMSLSNFEIGTLFTSSALGALASSFLLPALSDSKGRKIAVIWSTSGTAAGYFLQGIAHVWAFPLSYAVLLLGRIVAGLFGGIGAVLSAYVTEISDSDYGLLRRRMTAMAGVQQLSGLVLVPLAGFLATFGLYIPFLAVAATASLGTPILMAFFRNPAEVEAQGAATDLMVASTTASGETSPKPGQKPAPTGVQRPFWRDMVLNAYMLCYVCCGFFGVAITPLLAFLIQYPSYGLLRDDAYLTQEYVAQVASLLMLPQKLTELVTMLAVSPVLSRRLGDTACSVVGATTMSLGTLGLALLAWFGDDGTRQGTAEHVAVASAGTMPVSFSEAPAPSGHGGFEGRIWMVAASLVCHGFGDGLLLPILLGSAPRYRGEVYPDRLAGAAGYVSRGVFVGLVVGVPITLQVAEAFSLGTAWFLLLAVGFLSYVFLVFADRLGQAKVSARQVPGRVDPRRHDSESTSAGTSEPDAEVQMMPM